MSAAVKSHSESIFTDDPVLLFDLIKSFREITNVDEEVARSYVLQSNTVNLDSIYQEFDKYRYFLYNCQPGCSKQIPDQHELQEAIKQYYHEIQEAIKQFVEITKTNELEARYHLSKQNWECNAAVESFYKDKFDFVCCLERNLNHATTRPIFNGAPHSSTGLFTLLQTALLFS